MRGPAADEPVRDDGNWGSEMTNGETWPALPRAEWQETYDTLHM